MVKTLKFLFALLLTATAILFVSQAVAKYINHAQADEKVAALTLPPAFSISLFAGHLKSQDLSGARLMTVGPDGHLYLSLTNQNKVVMLPDVNQDGVADKVVTVIDQGLNRPHGIAFVKDQLYVANQDSVVKVMRKGQQWPATHIVPIIQHLATGGHTLKTLRLGPDNHFYINVGSSCNVCVEHDASRATIHRYTIEGKPAGALVTLGRHQQSPVWASGLRNSQGFAWHPETKVMYATNNGADNRSTSKHGLVKDAIPPEHFNQIKAGHNYGWPYCWGDQVMDPNFTNDAGYCQTTTPPVATFTSHATPMGFAFLHHANVPAAYKGDAIVALHGSWNRQQPAGYALSRIKFNDENKPIGVEPFVTGWLKGANAWGRPVDVVVGNDQAIYVSDDKVGVVYRITSKSR
jgi:glucose/arabinose dehydrogenase